MSEKESAGPSSLNLLLDIRDLLRWQVKLQARTLPHMVERAQITLTGATLQTTLHELTNLQIEAESLTDV